MSYIVILIAIPLLISLPIFIYTAYRLDFSIFYLYTAPSYYSLILTIILAIYIIPRINKYTRKKSRRFTIVIEFIKDKLKDIKDNKRIIITFMYKNTNKEELEIDTHMLYVELLNSIKTLSRIIHAIESILLKYNDNIINEKMNVLKKIYYQINDIFSGDKWNADINKISYTQKELFQVHTYFDEIEFILYDIMYELTNK